MIGSKRGVRSKPRLVRLRAHEGGVHGPVQKLLIEQDAVDVLEQDAVDVLEQDAVDVLHCGSTKKKRLFGSGDESAVLIIVLHTSSVLVKVRASKRKKAKINSDRKIIMAIFPEFGGLLQDPGYFYGIGGRNKKRRPVIILAPMVNHLQFNTLTFEPSTICVLLPLRILGT